VSENPGTISSARATNNWTASDAQPKGDDRKLALARKAQADPAGDEHRHRGARAEDAGHDRRGLDNLLEVVQQEEQRLVPQHALQALCERLVARLVDAKGGQDGGRHEDRVVDRREWDERDAIDEGITRGEGGAQGKTGLADPAGAGQGEEGHVVAVQQLTDGSQLPLPPDQGRAREREVRPLAVTRRRAANRTPRLLHERGTLAAVQPQRRGEHGEGFAVGMRAGAALQVADAAAAQARLLGEGFLAQLRRQPVAAQQAAESRDVGGVVGVHGRSLARTRQIVARWCSGLAGF
jgi:hypothetical protein